MRAAPLLLLLCRMSPGGSWMHVGSLPRAIHSCAPAGWSQLSHRSTERQKDVLSLHAEAGSSRPRRGDTEVMSGGSRGSAAGPWTCERINATSHAAVNAFFKAQGYKVACKPRDRVWVLLSSENVQSPDDRGQLLSSEIVGAVRLTPQRYKPLGDVFFLRSLCIDAGLRRQGLGTLLTRAATADSAGTPRYCFALEELVPLYTRTGWAATPPHMLPRSIRDRFRAVTDQTARKSKSIALLSHGLPVPTASSRETEVRAGDEGQKTRIILLQHAKEAARKTATGALLSHPSLAAHINLERWVWQGRSDNARINDLVASRPCVLVWADKSSFQGAQAGLPLRDACYVILDGTWQEASSMFRKCHALHRLPRLTLKPAVRFASAAFPRLGLCLL